MIYIYVYIIMYGFKVEICNLILKTMYALFIISIYLQYCKITINTFGHEVLFIYRYEK